MKLAAFALGLTLVATAQATTPPVEDVGDADSFGRQQIFLGLASTPPISVEEDCTVAPPGERCITLNPQPAPTSFDVRELTAVRLPAGATQSLLCFALTPTVSFEFFNLTNTPQPNARYSTRAVVTIENEVLNDPTLIDPATGQPYGGSFTITLLGFSEFRSIDPNERERKSLLLSRDCLGGLVSKNYLRFQGLSEEQVTQFFANPITLKFGIQGTVQIVSFALYEYGIRIYGDR